MRIGPYEVLAELGRGGMGAVYRARDERSGREVALKVMLAEGAADERFRERFARETRGLQALAGHPGIVAVRDAGVAGTTAYLAMDLLPGGSLKARLKGGPLPSREVARLGKKLAEALAFAHGRGVVHRDLKPENILFTADDEPVIADFGLVRLLGDGQRLTRTGELLGTPAFMAPEQADGDPRLIGPSVDVYGLGATLYAALTGRPPFQGTAHEVLLAVVRATPTRPSAMGLEVSAPLEDLLMRCLAKEPAQRPASAQALAGAFTRLTRPPRAQGARKAPVALVVGVVAVAGLAFVAGWFGRSPPAESTEAPPPKATEAPAPKPTEPPPKPTEAPPPPSALPDRAARERAVDEVKALERRTLDELLRLERPPAEPFADATEAGKGWERGECLRALATYDRDVQERPGEAEPLRVRAHFRLSMGDPFGCIADMDVARNSPAWARAQYAVDYKKGYALMAAGRPREGLELLNKSGTSASTRDGQALAYVRLGRLAEAKELFQGLSRPLAVGSILVREGKDEEALRLFDQLLRDDPGQASGVQFERGRVLARLGEHDAARTAFAEAARTTARNAPVRIAEALRLAGDRFEPRAILEPVRPERPREAGLHAMLARLEDDAGKPAAAREHAVRAIACDPSDPDARALLALLLLEASDPAGALAHCDRFLAELDPAAPPVLAARALALLALGDLEGARKDVADALARDRRSPEALAADGRVHLAAKQASEGRDLLSRAVGGLMPGTEWHRRVEAWRR